MSVEIYHEDLHLERSNPRNVLYINYKLLADLRYAGQPIVPQIQYESGAAQKDNVTFSPKLKAEIEMLIEFMGPIFAVDELPGVDLADFYLDESIPFSVKLQVTVHVLRQLMVIDEAGYVIFDRNGGNIRVLSWEPEKISTRQMDVEDMYDQLADCVYGPEENQCQKMVDIFQERKIDLWAMEVWFLKTQILGAAERAELADIFRPLKNTKLGMGLKELEEILLSYLGTQGISR